MVREELIFITGGVRSGKSAYAEKLVVELAERYDCGRLVYIASGVAIDDEMTRRIQRHQYDREQQQVEWKTIEQPKDFLAILDKLNTGDIVLWDCVTTWFTNEFYDGFDQGQCCFEEKGCLEKKFIALQETIKQLVALNIPIVIVSNEVLDEPVLNNAEVQLFQQWLGKIHTWLVKESTIAIEMEHGLVQRWK